MTAETTLIENIDWLVGWDAEAEQHCYLRHAALAFTGDEIVFVGQAFPGRVDKVLDGSGLMVAPGLIDLHTHPWSETLHRGFIEDFGNPALGMMAMYDMMPGWVEDEAAWHVSATTAYSELACSGVTTLVDISPSYAGWLDLAADSGLRSYLAPSMASASWALSAPDAYRYLWDDDEGHARFERAMDKIDAALSHSSGRLSAMVFPGQVDTCTADFFQRARDAAAERGLPMQTHAAQSLPEIEEMRRRHGTSPIAWLDQIGLLDPRLTIGHGIFLDHHSWLGAPGGGGEDLRRLADSGASVAHSPTVFARTAHGLESFARYRGAGVNVALATDTSPNNMLEELRLAAQLSRVQSGEIEGSTTADVFHAATVGGARALLRDDLGRLAPGCKADFFTVDLGNPLMQPLRDPLRNLVHTAAERSVRDVYVGGRRVVRDREIQTLDYRGAVSRLSGLSARLAERLPDFDPCGRRAEETMPLSLPLRQADGEL